MIEMKKEIEAMKAIHKSQEIESHLRREPLMDEIKTMIKSQDPGSGANNEFGIHKVISSIPGERDEDVDAKTNCHDYFYFCVSLKRVIFHSFRLKLFLILGQFDFIKWSDGPQEEIILSCTNGNSTSERWCRADLLLSCHDTNYCRHRLRM